MEITQEKFEEIKEKLYEEAKEKGYCKINELDPIINSQTWDELKEFITNNIDWFILWDVTLPDGHYNNEKVKFSIIDGKIHGEYIEYGLGFLSTHKKYCYVNGERHGEYVSYTIHNELCEKGNYVNGKLHGLYISYNSGRIRNVLNFVNGTLHGDNIWFDIHGKMRIYTYINGLQHPFKI